MVVQAEFISNHIIKSNPDFRCIVIIFALMLKPNPVQHIAYGSAFELTNKNMVLPDGYILGKLHKFDFWYLLVIE